MRIVDGYCTPGAERETHLPPDAALEQMDRLGIESAVIAPDDREIAVRCAAGNARLARMASEYPGRFIPAASVNPWLGEEGQELLSRAASAGARMLVLAPAVQGIQLTDFELLDPLLRLAAELQLPVYVHTGAHASSAPSQLALLALRHPGTRFVCGHAGTTDYAVDMPAILSARLDNLWFETSYVRPWALRRYLDQFGADRWIFGSSTPRNMLDFELEQMRQHRVPDDYPQVFAANLMHLLGNRN